MSSVPAHPVHAAGAADAADVFDRIRRLALLAGGAGVLLLLVGLLIHGGRAFFQAYLYAYVFWLGLAVGVLWPV